MLLWSYKIWPLYLNGSQASPKWADRLSQLLVEYPWLPIEFDFSLDMSQSTITVLVEYPGDPIKIDLSIDMGHKPVPESSNATRPVTSKIASPQFPFIGKVRPYIQ